MASMSDRELGEDESQEKRRHLLLDQRSEAPAEFTELKDARGVQCSRDVTTGYVSPEVNLELQRTISEVGRCATGNERLATICSRYVEALNEKYRLKKRLAEEQTLRAKVLETKQRLVNACARLQEQTSELRREAYGDGWTPIKVDDTPRNIVRRTPLGMIRKYVDCTKFAKGRKEDGGALLMKEETRKSFDEDAIQAKISLQSEGTRKESKNIAVSKRVPSESQSVNEGAGKRLEGPTTTLLRHASGERLSENEVLATVSVQREKEPRKTRLSFVSVTKCDIPPLEQLCPKNTKIGVSWASMDLTRR